MSTILTHYPIVLFPNASCTSVYERPFVKRFALMTMRRNESNRGDWPENLLQLQCYVHRLHAWCFCIGQANYNSLQFACFHGLLWKKLKHFANCQVVPENGKRQTACLADLRQHRARASGWI